MVPLWPLLLPGPLHRDSFSTDCLETWGCSRVRLCFSFLVYSYLSHLTASPWARNDVLWQLRFPGASHTVESTILAHSCCCWAGHGGGGNTKGHQLWLSVHLAQRPTICWRLPFLLTHEVGAILQILLRNEISRKTREESIRCSALPSVPSKHVW